MSSTVDARSAAIWYVAASLIYRNKNGAALFVRMIHDCSGSPSSPPRRVISRTHGAKLGSF